MQAVSLPCPARLRAAVAGITLAVFVAPAFAAGLNLRFVNQTGLPDGQVFVTFQNANSSLAATYGKNIAVGPVTAGDKMTKSYSLATVGATGFKVTNADSIVIFVSYAASKARNGFAMGADLSGNAEPSYIGTGGANYSKCYQPFEITALAGETAGQGNLTNINYFAAPISLTSYHGGVKGKKLQQRGYYGGMANGTDNIAAALKAVTGGAATATATFSGQLLRYIGPSSYGAGATPYPTFNAYLSSLNTASPPIKIQNHNAFNTQANPGAGNINYDYYLDFTGTVAADGTITLAGKITTQVTNFGQSPTAGPTYDNLTLIISPTTGLDTSEAIFTNTIYGQADPKGPGLGSTTFSGANWAVLAADMTTAGLALNQPPPVGSGPGTTYSTTQSLLIGEITTGLLGGFVGSDATYTGGTRPYAVYDGMQYKDVPSEAWWNTATIPAPTTLQPNHPFYSTYSKTIFAATDNEVYSIPFSDRFGQGPLMQTQLYNGQTVDTWVVTLGKPLFLPTVAVSGKHQYATPKTKVAVKGTADGSVTKVEIKNGAKKYAAKVANQRWSKEIPLVKGKNHLDVQGRNAAGGLSPVVPLVITRK